MPWLVGCLSRLPSSSSLDMQRPVCFQRRRKALRQEMPASAHRLRFTCEVHKCHTSCGDQLSINREVISGVVNIALAQRPGGAVQALRFAVACFLNARLRIIHGVPPREDSREHQYREVVLRVYLGRAHDVAGMRRALVLRSLLNGSWEDTRHVQHYCWGDCSREHTDPDAHRQAVTADIVACVLPHGCPSWATHRWTKANLSVHWCGLLIGVHNILPQVLPAWLRALSDPKQPVPIAEFSLARKVPLLLEGAGGWRDDYPPVFTPACSTYSSLSRPCE